MGKNKKISKGDSAPPDSLHLTALVRADIGGRPLVATNKIFLVSEEARRCNYDSCDSLFRDLALLCLSDPYHLSNSIQSSFGEFFFLLRKSCTASLPFIWS